jgi:Flp pilus assembly protein TadD
LHLSKAAELDDSNAEVLKTLGAMLLKYGKESDTNRAQKALKKASELKPDDAEIWSNYAYTLYLDRMFNDSIDKFKKALEIRPDYPEANYNIALAYSGARKYDMAREHWEKVVKLVPGTPLADKARQFIAKLDKAEK